MDLSLQNLFGSVFIDTEDFLKLCIRFALDFIVAFIIIRKIYYPIYPKRDYIFTYFVFNIITFFICFLLRKVPMEMGFALGLFAVFGILRYRTEAIAIKEMTYLFIVIGVAMINALSNKSISVVEILFANAVVVGLTYVSERMWRLKAESEKNITYEKIELIKPAHHEELLADLKERTGLDIHKIEIGKIDFLRDVAQVKIFYYNKDVQDQIDAAEEK